MRRENAFRALALCIALCILTIIIWDQYWNVLLRHGYGTTWFRRRAEPHERAPHSLQENDESVVELEEYASLGELLSAATCTSNSDCTYGLVCVNATCTGCSSTEQCSNIQLDCDANSNRCVHKPLSRFTWRDGLTFGLIFVIAGLSSTGGVGGGFLFVPVLVLLTGFQARRAAALSQALVTGGSGANAFYGLITRHPFRERPRIDYYVVTVFMATILCGTSVGVILNILFPNFFTLFMLAVLVAYVFYISIKKAIQLWKDERAASRNVRAQDQGADAAASNDVNADGSYDASCRGTEAEHCTDESFSIHSDQIVDMQDTGHERTFSVKSESVHSTEGNEGMRTWAFGRLWTRVIGFFDPTLQFHSADEIMKYESRQYPLGSLVCVLAIFAFLVVLSVFRGGGSSRVSVIGVENCSAIFISLYIIQEMGLLCFSVAAGFRNLRMHLVKLRVGYEFYERDMEWTRNRILWIAPLMIFLGAVGAWVGAGGSFMSTPILIAGVGMDPLVVQATAGFMNFVAAFSSAIQYYVNHELPLDYGLALGGTAFLGSLSFVVFFNRLVYKFKLQAILVFIMAGVMFGAAVLNIYAGALELKTTLNQGKPFPFGNICG